MHEFVNAKYIKEIILNNDANIYYRYQINEYMTF